MREQKTYAVAVAWQLGQKKIAAEAIAVIATDPGQATENGRRYAAEKVPGALHAVSILEIPPEVLPDRQELIEVLTRLQQENNALHEELRRYRPLVLDEVPLRAELSGSQVLVSPAQEDLPAQECLPQQESLSAQECPDHVPEDDRPLVPCTAPRGA